MLAQAVAVVARPSSVAAFHACVPFAPSAAVAATAASVPYAFRVFEVAATTAQQPPHVGGHRHRETDPDRGLGLGLGPDLGLDLAWEFRALKNAL